MKNIILFIWSLLPIQNTYSQSASSLYKKADSLYKAKDYKNSAIANSEGIRLEGKAATVGRYWGSASAWAQAGNADSAFYYLSLVEKADKITMDEATRIENDKELNPIKENTRWQPIINAILNKSVSWSEILAEELRAGKRINPTGDKYWLALAWAVKKNPDSVLHYLESIIYTNHNRYIAYDEISEEKLYSFLYNSPRWITLIGEVKKNALVFTCAHTPRGQRIPMTATIGDASNFLKSDGKGSYRNNENKVSSHFFTAYNLALSGIAPLQGSGLWTNASSRYITINLNKPIKKSGSIKQGVIKDHFATFHAFYKIDTALKLDLIYNFNEIPIGTTIESPRTDIEFYIKGRFHMLKFGYWGLGDCGEIYAHGGKINGAGTTSVKITRHTATKYTIEAPKGSVGRLWDIDNRTKPVDKGLFESGFIIHVENQ